MPRRSKAELIDDLKNKYRSADIMLDCMAEYGPSDVDLDKDDIIPLSDYLDWIESGKVTASQAVGAMQEALNEHGLALLEWTEEEPQTAQAVLESYRSRTGRCFWQDAGDTKRAIAAILKTKMVRNEAEYYLLKEIQIDVSSSLIQDNDRELAEHLLREFEQRAIQSG